MSETPDIWREIGPAFADAVAEARWPAGEGARILGPDGQPVALEQADMFPPVRIGPMDREITPDSVDKAMRFAMATTEVTLATLGLPTPVEPDRRDRTIAELRAVLAPLLDDPEIYTDAGICIFCRQYEQVWNREQQRFVEDTPHAPDCAVLRRDELLGR